LENAYLRPPPLWLPPPLLWEDPPPLLCEEPPPL